MFGSISGYSYAPYYAAFSIQNSTRAAQASTIPAQQTESITTPVQPVTPAREVISNDSKFSIESMLNQHASDPVAMAARMRIQCPEQTSGQSPLPGMEAPASKQEPMKSAREVFEDSECQTCENRKYQDGSDEHNVSFKAAAHIDPNAAASAVRAHENQHVSNAYKKAAQDNGKVLRASVTLHTSICPECGRSYVSGGTTNTQIKYYNEENPYQKDLKQTDGLKYTGMNVDLTA